MTHAALQPTHEQVVQQLASSWLAAKAQEEAASKLRLDIETQLCASFELKNEGTIREQVGPYQVSVTTKLTRALDPTKLLAMDKEIPAPILNRLVEYTPKLNLRELRYIEENEPVYYKAFAAALTVKPAKTSVSVELK